MIKTVLSVIIAGSKAMGPKPEFLKTIGSSQNNIEYIIVTTNWVFDFGPFEKAGALLLREPVGTTIPKLRAIGFMHASAEIVAMTEDFCLPSKQWAKNIIDAHQKSNALAIGGPIRRRDGTTGDWALTFCEYARFMPPKTYTDCNDLSSVNISFKKTRLLKAYGSIPAEIEEFQLLPFLLNKGCSLEWQNNIIIFDVNDQPFYRSFASFFFHGRYYGGKRVENSGLHIKIIRALLSPVVPFMQTFRIAKNALYTGYFRNFLNAIILIFFLSSCWALGEGIGSIFGEGDSKRKWV